MYTIIALPRHAYATDCVLSGAQWLDKLQEGMDKFVRRDVHDPADLLHLFRCCVLDTPACSLHRPKRQRLSSL